MATERLASDVDVIIESNVKTPPTGIASIDAAAGDIIFRTSGVERARILSDGTGTGWPTVIGGSLTALGDVTINSDSDVSGAGDFIVQTAGVERGRIKFNGASTGLFLPPAPSSDSQRMKNMVEKTLMSASSERDQLRDLARGFLSQPYETGITAFTGFAPVSQTVYGALIGLLAGDVVTNIIVPVTTLAAGTAPTSVKVALYDKNGVQLAVSGELKASTIWTAGGATKYAVAPLSAAYTVLTSDAYYAVFWQDTTVAWGTTALQIGRGAGTGGQTGAIGSGFNAAVSQAAQAALPAPATFAATGLAVWIGVS